MTERSGASLGDETVFDGLAAIIGNSAVSTTIADDRPICPRLYPDRRCPLLEKSTVRTASVSCPERSYVAVSNKERCEHRAELTVQFEKLSPPPRVPNCRRRIHVLPNLIGNRLIDPALGLLDFGRIAEAGGHGHRPDLP